MDDIKYRYLLIRNALTNKKANDQQKCCSGKNYLFSGRLNSLLPSDMLASGERESKDRNPARMDYELRRETERALVEGKGKSGGGNLERRRETRLDSSGDEKRCH